jgi:hypothetical protein
MEPTVKTARIAAGVLIVLVVSACIAGSGDSQHAAEQGWVFQFLLGLWHGIIAPFTLIGEVINALAPHLLPWRLHLYETHAAGAPYDVGFYFGLAGSPIVIGRRWR